MSYTQYLGVGFGSGRAGLTTVGYRLYDNGNTPVGTRTIVGVVDVGHGYYAATITFEDGFVGRVQWDTGEASPLYVNSFVNSLEQTLLARLTADRAALLDKLYVGAIDEPVVAVLAPTAPEQCVSYIVTRDGQGNLAAGVVITFKLVSLPAELQTGSYRTTPFNASSDANGLVQIALRRGATYTAERGARGATITFEVPDEDTFELPLLLGNP